MNWQLQRDRDLERLLPLVSAAKARRSRGEKHPIEDFLWEYYGLRPGKLLHWSPGAGVRLEGAHDAEFPDSAGYSPHPLGGRWLNPHDLPEKRRKSFAWIRDLLTATAARPPFFGCLGLHEWAMVYDPEDIRHPQLGLRLPQAQIRSLVETLPIRCSHYDAFRFFSHSARPRNQLQPRAESRIEQEQPACLHANMDLLKWCLKAMPWIPTALLTDALLLARDARILDMRASPYDVSSLGEPAIPLETPEGRRHYVREQEAIATRAAPIRQRLTDALNLLVSPPSTLAATDFLH